MVSSPPTPGTIKAKKSDDTSLAVLSKEQLAQARIETEQREAAAQMEVQKYEARNRLEKQAADIDLEELAPLPLKVSVRDYRVTALTDDEGNPLTDEDGNALKGREYFARTATIETYVSTDVLFKILLLKNRFDAMAQAGELSSEDGERFTTEQVLDVWRKTEPHMTYEHLREILDFNKIKAVFARFFTS